MANSPKDRAINFGFKCKSMLGIKPICENCGKHLPNESSEAMICSFECTFCVENILLNVCPNCGGGFEKRPVRPKEMLLRFPMKSEPLLKPVQMDLFEPLLKKNRGLNPADR